MSELPETSCEIKNGEIISIRTIRYDNIEKLFGKEAAEKIRERLRKS